MTTTRFPSPYGGTETIAGTYSLDSILTQWGKTYLKGWKPSPIHSGGKLFDFFRDDRTEVIGFPTRRPGEIRVHVINHNV